MAEKKVFLLIFVHQMHFFNAHYENTFVCLSFSSYFHSSPFCIGRGTIDSFNHWQRTKQQLDTLHLSRQ